MVSDSTRWTIIRDAARGEAAAREAFALRYEPVVRAYLGARWRQTPLLADVEDAAQEVFLACFREDGPLDRAEPDRPGGFRAYFRGVVRNVARRFEKRRAKAARQPDSRLDLEAIEARDEPLSAVFDRAWARAIIRQATELQAVRARDSGAGAERRVELLRLRFREDRPIREIASAWEVDPAWLHHQYAQARKEFVASLRHVVREHHADAPERVDEECTRLVRHLRHKS